MGFVCGGIIAMTVIMYCITWFCRRVIPGKSEKEILKSGRLLSTRTSRQSVVTISPHSRGASIRNKHMVSRGKSM